ncbi:MAG: RnfABCDGE type electron transport complex subunit D [Firmicutes bacterium]|nr:RnfABCDGE type electron transport complex subunit D [Bacillota bacterium]
MANKYHGNLVVSSSPHMVSPTDTTKIMGTVMLALLPALAVGVYQFGLRALVLTCVCVIASVGFEYLYNLLMKRPQTVGDLSAALTGLLIALNCPSSLPFTITIVGCFAAVIVVKQLFGGLGQNIVNPAVTARVFMFIAFATEMTSWPVSRISHVTEALNPVDPEMPDAITAATALGQLGHGDGTLASVEYSNLDLFLGNTGGCIGEISALALIIGGAFLIWRKIISPIIPLTFIGTVFLLGLIWGGFDGAIFHICAGGVMLGAFFCATDYVTSPTLPMGKVIFGIGCGIFTMLIRIFGSYPEGVSFAILLMNILTPFIDRFCEGRAFPLPKAAKGGDGDGK